jgi:hypothetical protein
LKGFEGPTQSRLRDINAQGIDAILTGRIRHGHRRAFNGQQKNQNQITPEQVSH